MFVLLEKVISFYSHIKNQIVNNIQSFDIIIRFYKKDYYVYGLLLSASGTFLFSRYNNIKTRKKSTIRTIMALVGTQLYIYIYYILSYVYTLQQIIISNERTTEVQLFPN